MDFLDDNGGIQMREFLNKTWNYRDCKAIIEHVTIPSFVESRLSMRLSIHHVHYIRHIWLSIQEGSYSSDKGQWHTNLGQRKTAVT
jgi:hypothetical protein